MARRSSTRGARGANAGDDYHELWALRQAISLLDPASSLTAITVEGLHPDDEASAPPAAWDGVDCAYYFGGESLATATRAGFDQVKYSTAEPDRAWSAARLTRRSRRTRASSVIGRLGAAFEGFHAQRPDLVERGELHIRLVSNQPIGDDVLEALSAPAHGTTPAAIIRRKLAQASTLPSHLWDAFFGALDVSQCGAGSRFAMEARLLQTMSEWTHPNARAALDLLRRQMRELMMPERAGAIITRREVLSWFGYAGETALFPCPAALRVPSHVVARQETAALLALINAGEQRVCLYGGGGVGKTTVLLGLAALLPAGSPMICFDCYGGGRYLDAESPRHRPAEAFLQMANEMAAQLKLPPLLDRKPDILTFAERLRQASDALAITDPDALLVLAVDAADNATHAAQMAAPPESAFVRPLVRLGQLPPNVRLIISTRTSRRESLDIDSRFKLLEVRQFSPGETATYARLHWPEAPDDWVEDFHALSNGIPRVQRYAFDGARHEPALALEALRPNGKALDEVFEEQLQEAIRRAGLTEADAQRVAQGLMALPRAVPVRHLSPVVGRSENHLREFATDLAPGLRLVDDAIGFADEDFEAFIRGIAVDMAQVRNLVADRLVATEQSDVYAAVHVAPALLAAGRRRALIELVRQEGPPSVIQDPVLRREVQLQRMRIAIRVCRESGDIGDALLTNLRGAAALKTNAAIRTALLSFPDLAVRFAYRSVAQMFLQDPEEVEHIGRFLFHRLAADAERRDGVGVREDGRWLIAWMQNRQSALAASQRAGEQLDGWEIDDEEIAAEATGILRAFGPHEAWQRLRRWRPPTVRFRAFLLAAPSLVAAGQGPLLESALTELGHIALDPILRVPLAMQDGAFDAARVEKVLRLFMRHGLVQPGGRDSGWELPTSEVAYEESILTACELCLAAGIRSETLSSIMSLFGAPGQKRGITVHPARVDLRLRALAILARLRSERLQVSDLLPPKPVSTRESTREAQQEAKRWEEDYRERQELVGPLVPLYDARAQCLLSLVPSGQQEALLRDALDVLERDAYRMAHRFGAMELRARAAKALLTLLSQPDVDPEMIWRHADALATPVRHGFSQRDVECWIAAAARPSLHSALVDRAAAIALEVLQAQMSAREQVDALCAIARALLPISGPDAQAVFFKALDAAAGIDEDAMHLVPLLADLAVASAPSLDTVSRRQVARDIAIVLEDAAIRLSGYDGFPWTSAAVALAALDLPLALAAATRWDDERVVSRNDLLPSILSAAVEARSVTPTAALSLLPLLDNALHARILERIVVCSDGLDNARRNAMAERVAADELLTGDEGVGRGGTAALALATDLRAAPMPGPWERVLAERVEFHEKETSARDNSAVNAWPPSREAAERTADEVIREYPWGECDLLLPEELAAAVHTLSRLTENGPYVRASAVYSHIQERVPFRDRIRYLETLVALMSGPSPARFDAADALGEALKMWQGQPAVDAWIVGSMIRHLPDVLPAFLRSGAHVGHPLQFICRRIASADAASRDNVCDALLRGLELHVEELDATDIYWIVRLIAEFVDAKVLGRVAKGLTEQLLARVAERHRAEWDIADLPTENSAALGRVLFALLGDMDTRIRWRAAHVLRRLAEFEEAELVDAAVAQYERMKESLFRKPEAPFYWQAARLWLVIALCRIAHEHPDQVARHSALLIKAGTDQAFPHLLLRDFASRAVDALHAAGVAIVRPEDLAALADALGANRPRSRPRRPLQTTRSRPEQPPTLRYHFDTVDTVPYWYEHAVDSFTDASMQEFLARADTWIIDKWGATPTTTYWAEEPRRHRLDESDWGAWSHRHGSLPILERFSTYLEWHAMWCTAGEMLSNHTLRLPDRGSDDYNTIEGWLRRNALRDPPLWEADVRTTRPAHAPLFVSIAKSGWEEAVSELDFVDEASLREGGSTLVLGAAWEHASSPLYTSAHVRAAYVTPSRALPLLRALQTIDSPDDFRLPDVGDHLEIRSGGHLLLGVLLRRERESGLDEHDPLRRGARGLVASLPRSVAAALGLTFVHDQYPGWQDTTTGEMVIRCENWSEVVPQSRHGREGQYGSGWRLVIDRHCLGRLMTRRKLDILLSVGIERTVKRYSSHDNETEGRTQSVYHSRLFLLRRDGELLTADGPIGTWTAPRP